MTQQERDRIARAIYEAVTVGAGYEGHRPWGSLKDHEKWKWQRAADRAWAHTRVMAGVRIAEGRAS